MRNKKKKPVTGGLAPGGGLRAGAGTTTAGWNYTTGREESSPVLVAALEYAIVELLKYDKSAAGEDVALDPAAKAAQEAAFRRSADEIRAIAEHLVASGDISPYSGILAAQKNKRGADLLKEIKQEFFMGGVNSLGAEWAAKLCATSPNGVICGKKDFMHLSALVHLVEGFDAEAKVQILADARDGIIVPARADKPLGVRLCSSGAEPSHHGSCRVTQVDSRISFLTISYRAPGVQIVHILWSLNQLVIPPTCTGVTN